MNFWSETRGAYFKFYLDPHFYASKTKGQAFEGPVNPQPFPAQTHSTAQASGIVTEDTPCGKSSRLQHTSGRLSRVFCTVQTLTFFLISNFIQGESEPDWLIIRNKTIL